MGSEALIAYRKANDHLGIIESLLLLGHAYHSNADELAALGHEDSDYFLVIASNYYKQAFGDLSVHDPLNAVDAEIKLANLAMDRGKLLHASNLFHSLSKNPLVEMDYTSAYQYLLGLGGLKFINNDFEKAIEFFNRGLLLSQQANAEEDISKWEAVIGYAYELNNNYEEAILAYQESIEIQERLGQISENERFSIGYYSRRFDIYENLIGIFLNNHQYFNAFYYLERSKGKALRGQLDNFQSKQTALTADELMVYLNDSVTEMN